MRRRLAGRMEALERLRHLSAQVVGATSLQRLVEVVLEGLRPEIGATRAVLGAARPGGDLSLRALAGFPDPAVADDIVKADAELRLVLPMNTLRAGQVVGMADLDQVTAGLPVLGDLVARMGVASLALVPLLSRGRFLGLLALCWTEHHPLNREQEALLGLAGNQIAGALEAALRLEEAERAAGEAQAVFYAIADGVLLTDPYGRVTAMNRALEALTGWTEAEARGRPYAEVLPLATDRADGPADLVSRYGRRVPVAVSSAPIFDARGRVVGGVDVIRDVSKEREIDEVKSALISTVSHERRTPLTLIHGFAELLVLRDMPAERQRSSAVEILDASRRLARPHRRPAERVPDGVGPPGPRPPAPGPGHGGRADPLPVPGDGRQAHPPDQAPGQPAGGLGRPRQGRADFDQPGRQCDQILPRGRRGPRHRGRRRRHGAGECSGPGNRDEPTRHGAVVREVLPGRPRGGPPGRVLARGRLGVPLHPSHLRRACRERPMKLLIADDEPAVRALVHVTLEGDDYEILEAADGVEALEVARGEAPRLVLLDIMMPRLDGLEVCRQLKADPDTSDIVVVMLTAQAQERDRDQGLAAGADDYFTKPFSPLALLNMVERVRHNQSGAD